MINELFNLLRCPKSNLDLVYNEVVILIKNGNLYFI